METDVNGLEKHQRQWIPEKETELLFCTAGWGSGQVSSVWAVPWEALISHPAPDTALGFLSPPVQEGLTWKCLGVSTPLPAHFFFFFFGSDKISLFQRSSGFRFCCISVPICQLPSCCKMPGYVMCHFLSYLFPFKRHSSCLLYIGGQVF